jgi:hypothetical protein
MFHHFLIQLKTQNPLQRVIMIMVTYYDEFLAVNIGMMYYVTFIILQSRGEKNRRKISKKIQN